MTRQRPGGTSSVSDCGAGNKAEPGEASGEIAGQPPLAAEQMIAAGDIEPYAIGAVARRPWRITAAPSGKTVETCGIGRRIGHSDLERACSRPKKGARIGERQARRKAQRLGATIHRDEPHAAML